MQPLRRTITIIIPEMESATHSKGVVTHPATEIEVDLNDLFSME